MKLLKFTFLLSIVFLLNSCASGYQMINPNILNYVSNDTNNGVKLEYKYNLLDKKYAKKEMQKGIRLIAVKITNDTNNNLTFGKEVKLVYSNGNELIAMAPEKVFSSLKQTTPTYLLYLLLTPMNLYTSKTDSSGFQETTSTTPIGLVVGPGLAFGNMIAAGSANTKFKAELLDYNMNGTVIKKGETVTGLIGVRSDNYDAIKVKVE